MSPLIRFLGLQRTEEKSHYEDKAGRAVASVPTPLPGAETADETKS